jgi:hypothetical protein
MNLRRLIITGWYGGLLGGGLRGCPNGKPPTCVACDGNMCIDACTGSYYCYFGVENPGVTGGGNCAISRKGCTYKIGF